MSKDKTLDQSIIEAIAEANILEQGLDSYDIDHMLVTAQRLSGAPYSFVKEVFYKKVKKAPF